MYLNDKIALPCDTEFTKDNFERMRPQVAQLRASGEVHITTSEEGLILELLNPHNAIDRKPLTKEEMIRRGLSDTVAFFDLERIAFARNKIVLFPRRTNGLRVDRKRTLSFQRGGWISTYRTFFESFRVLEVRQQMHRTQITQNERLYA